ncbi:MAG: MBL fold metallo-hydrolase, partial [Candidatus Njordarchaeota archaeon]
KHLLALGILPEIEGLYKNDPQQTDVDAILISHPHGDHYDYIRFVKDEIPIYCGEVAKSIIIAREKSGTKGPRKEYYIANLTSKEDVEYKKFETFITGDRRTIRSIEIEPVHVDHSIPGAYGYIIHTTSGTVVYSGDLRLHGTHSKMTRDFIEKAKDANPEILIIEGTNIPSANISSENEVKEKCNSVVSNTRQLVLVNFAVADMDRLRTFYEVAEKNDRKLVISTKQAFIVDSLQDKININLEDILILQKEKQRINEWEKRIIDKYSDNIIDSMEVNKIQNEIILVLTFYDMNEMVEIRPDPGSIYILSQSEPFNEEMEIDFNKLKNWLSYYGVPMYQIHASGHATPQELKNMISEIDPKKLYLIHTEGAELYKRYVSDLGIRTIIPEIGKRYR